MSCATPNDKAAGDCNIVYTGRCNTPAKLVFDKNNFLGNIPERRQYMVLNCGLVCSQYTKALLNVARYIFDVARLTWKTQPPGVDREKPI